MKFREFVNRLLWFRRKARQADSPIEMTNAEVSDQEFLCAIDEAREKVYFVVRDDDVSEPSLTDWPEELQAVTFRVYPTEASAPHSDQNHARETTTEGNTMNTPAEAGGKKAAKPPVMRDYYARDKLTGKERIISAPSLGDANRFAARDMIEVRLLSTADAMRLAGQGIGPEVLTDRAQEALPLAGNAGSIDPTRIESGSLSLGVGQDGAAAADDPT